MDTPDEEHTVRTNEVMAIDDFLVRAAAGGGKDAGKDDRPPPPAAAALLASLPQTERGGRHPGSILGPYIPTETIYNVFSWIGYSLYSLTNISSLFTASPNPEQDHQRILHTIHKLDSHLQFLDKKIDKMNTNTIQYIEKAKQLFRNKNKTGAMHQIRLQKMYDREIQKLEALKFNIESHILHMDSVDIMMVTVDTIKSTSGHFQTMNNAVNITKLESTLDEMVEHRDTATDIQSILTDVHSWSENNFDDAELLQELEAMTNGEDKSQEEPPRQPPTQPPLSVSCVDVSALPLAPTHSLPRRMSRSTTLPDRSSTAEKVEEVAF